MPFLVMVAALLIGANLGYDFRAWAHDRERGGSAIAWTVGAVMFLLAILISPPAHAATATFTLPSVCESTVVTADGRDSVVASYPLTDLAEVYLWARPCDADHATLIAGKNVEGLEGRRDSLAFSSPWGDSCFTVAELYVTTRRATQARSLPGNLVVWPSWRWTGSEWRRR